MVDFKKARKKARLKLLQLQPESVKAKRSVVARLQPRCAQLFFTYQGRGMRIMMDPAEFLGETGLWNRNLVMMRDYAGFFYHAGLNREIPDLESLIEWQRNHRDGLPGVRETYCIGSSAGGYAALVFGHYLGADRVFAFAPQTEIDLELLRGISGRDDTWRFPEEHRDLRLLLGSWNGVTQYEIYYNEGHTTDRRFAEQIAACPGVSLRPQPGEEHGVIHSMFESGDLQRVFPSFVEAHSSSQDQSAG